MYVCIDYCLKFQLFICGIEIYLQIPEENYLLVMLKIYIHIGWIKYSTYICFLLLEIFEMWMFQEKHICSIIRDFWNVIVYRKEYIDKHKKLEMSSQVWSYHKYWFDQKKLDMSR